MIRIVIDTNRLPTNPSSPSAAFRRICGLVNKGVVQVVLPSVLTEEWRTQQLAQLKAQLQKAKATTKGLLDGGHLDGHPQVGILNPVLAALDELSEEAEELSKQTLRDWLTNSERR